MDLTKFSHPLGWSPSYSTVKLLLRGTTLCTHVAAGEIQALRVYLCADEVLIITIDTRTGRLSLRDTGDLASAGRGPRFAIFSDKLNENPSILMDALCRLRLSVCA